MANSFNTKEMQSPETMPQKLPLAGPLKVAGMVRQLPKVVVKTSKYMTFTPFEFWDQITRPEN